MNILSTSPIKKIQRGRFNIYSTVEVEVPISSVNLSKSVLNVVFADVTDGDLWRHTLELREDSIFYNYARSSEISGVVCWEVIEYV